MAHLCKQISRGTFQLPTLAHPTQKIQLDDNVLDQGFRQPAI